MRSKILIGFLMMCPLVAFAQTNVNMLLEEENMPDELMAETVSFEDNLDEEQIPYTDFSQHESEEPPMPESIPRAMTLDETVAPSKTIDSHPLFSLETTGSVFDQFSEFEKNKMLMNLQTEQEKMQLEWDRVRLQRLKLQKELAEFEGQSDTSDSDSSGESMPAAPQVLASETPQNISSTYTIKNILGVGNRFIGVLQNTRTQAETQVKEGGLLDDYTVVKISPKTGIVIEKDGQQEKIGLAE